MSTLAPGQIEQLLKPINPARVRRRDGMSYVESHDVKAHLTRIFGFGAYDSEVFDLTLLYERAGTNSRGKEAVSVGYRAGVRLTVRDPAGAVLATYTEYAAGGASGFPVSKLADAHDMAMKSAASYALKRCAIHLGDQFGLSLYNDGSTAPFVGGTLVGAPEPAAPDDVAVTDETEAAAPAASETESEPARQWVDAIHAAADLDALRALWRDAAQQGAMTDGLRAVFTARQGELIGAPE